MDDNNNFCVYGGEVLGMAGLVGAGRTEIVESLFGLRKDYKGETYIKGNKVTIRKPSDAINKGISLITEDRKKTGLNLMGSVKDNISTIALKNLCVAGWIQRGKERRVADEQIKSLRIKTPSYKQIVSFLSGGNQQKVVIAKWLLMNSDIIIMDEPTRGVDVGAKREIYLLINELKAQGKAIIMISSEMPELIGMCDRMVVMYKGRITGILDKNEITQENIMAKAIDTEEVQSNV
jgi:ABC-type sugar transport system ATPase subunit